MPSITLLSLRSFNLVAIVGLAAVLGQSCSDEQSSSNSEAPDGSIEAGATGGSGGVAGTGGEPDGSLGGTGATAGAGESSDASDNDAGPVKETVEPCPGTVPLDIGALGFPACPLCEDAVCVPNAFLTSFGEGAALLGECDTESKCVPRSYVETTGNFLFKTCTAFGAAEGRCVNKCIPAVANQIGLEQDVCGVNEVCAPCFMPTDGSPTGACGLGCDVEPTGEPYLFEKCCGTEGVCVPSDLVPDEQRSALDPSTCTEAGTLCAPSVFVSPGYVPPTCESVAGYEGRCITECIGQVAEASSFLPQDLCADGSLCAPCYDPRTGEPTGACSINGDEPVEPQRMFGSCCDGDGICVPTTVVPQDVVGALGQDTCAVDEVCAPEVFADSTYIAPTCTSIGGAEGRCISECVPELQRFGTYLPQDLCEDGSLCAPCFDPITGESTGACGVNGDEPANPDPYVFPSCCDGEGKCVPEALVPASQQGSLGADTCGSAELCAPTDFIDPTFTPATCTSFLDAEGRCIPTCVGAVASMARYLPQDVCAMGEACAPCYNPYDGSPTGACSLNGDAPENTTPVVFENCCNSGGKCVPSSLVSPQQATFVGPGDCPGSDGGATSMICAPNFAITGGHPDCDLGPEFGPGVCFDPCTMPVVAANLAPPQGNCADGLLCLPCYYQGASLGVCDSSVPPPLPPDAGDGG